MEGNNLDREIAEYRDRFLKAESDLIDKLKERKDFKQTIESFGKFSSKELFDTAKKLVSDVQEGNIQEKDFDTTELKIILLLSAIRDSSRGAREIGPRTINQREDDEMEK